MITANCDRCHGGWSITYSAARPVTGQWRAARFGVGMCANSREALIRMIDVNNAERRNRNQSGA